MKNSRRENFLRGRDIFTRAAALPSLVGAILSLSGQNLQVGGGVSAPQ